MISIQSHGRLCREYLFIALPNLFPTPELGHKLSDKLRYKSFHYCYPYYYTPCPQYTVDNLQQIFKTILKAQTLTILEDPWYKPLKAYLLDIYYGKSLIECYNFYQQCEDYFTIVGVKKTNQISFTTSVFQDQISFHQQQYKGEKNVNSTVPVI